jgi:hypothetical protein
MTQHRVHLMNPVLRRYPDPTESNDPQIRELLTSLATLEVAPLPRAHFRAELRAQLVAVAPRLVAEGLADNPATKHVPEAVPGSAGSRAVAHLRERNLARPLAIAASIVTVLALLFGGATWISRKSLPGDTLYGLKRAGENFQEAMTSGDTARAKLQLSFAGKRYDEVGDLLPRASALAAGYGPQADGGQLNSRTATLVASTLQSADNDVRKGKQTLGAQAMRNSSGSVLRIVTAWAPGPLSTLREILARRPAGSTHTRAASSLRLLMAADTRAQRLQALPDCACLASTPTDALGPIPCTKCAAPPGAPGHTGSATPTSPSSGSTNSATAGAPSVAQHSGAVSTSPGGGGLVSSGATVTIPASTLLNPPPTLPSLPGLPSSPGLSGVPTLPVTTSPSDPPSSEVPSCSAVVATPPISFGSCGPSLTP